MTIMIPAWVNGVLTPVEKLEAHEKGLRHMAVSVFVLRGDALLIQRRALGKYHTPGLWANTCCTHPLWGEASAACAERRLDEELGITGVPLTPRGVVEYRAEVGHGLIEHEVVGLYAGEAAPDLKFTPNPEEVMETRWVPLDVLEREVTTHPGRFTPWLRIYLAEHRSKIFEGALAAE